LEIIANAVQTVNTNQNVYFTDTVTCGGPCVSHRDDSGLVTLRGLTNQCRARFKVTFGGNIAIPTGGTVGPIQLAIAIDGEAVPSTTMIVTPAAVENYFNVSSEALVDVPANCCLTVSIKNTSTQDVSFANSNLIIERVA
jgi:hypothetical protein